MGSYLFGLLHDHLWRNVVVINVLGKGLRDFPILTKLTLKIAPHGCQRKRSGARKNMEEGFLLDRIQMNCTGVSVDQAIIFSIPILTNSTKTPFPFGNAAPFRAQFALYLSPIQGSEVRREFCLNEALLRYLCPCGFWKTEEMCSGKNTETRSAKLQKLPLRQVGFRDPPTLSVASDVG
jgi:hypothetical protein